SEKLGRDGKRYSAGNVPSSLAVQDVGGPTGPPDGVPDLQVGNEFGDVLTLLGNGDGTFRPYQRVDHRVALAVADVHGDGKDDLVFSDNSLDQVTVQYSRPGQDFTQDRANGVLAPGAVAVGDLDGDGIKDLVVANGGGNDVLVYLGTGGGQFTPARPFASGDD